MPFNKDTELNPKNQAPGAYQRYPLNMHRGEFPNHQSRQAHSEADEAEALTAGWSTVAPKVPEPQPEKPVLTLEERVAALEDWAAKKGKK